MIRLVPTWAIQYEAFWDAIRNRNMWFIKLRYGAVLMLTTFILASEFFLGFKFTQTQTLAISAITISILFYNILLHIGKKHIKSIAGQFNPFHLSVIQMLLDFIALFLTCSLYRWNRNSALHVVCFSHDNRKLSSSRFHNLFGCNNCSSGFWRHCIFRILFNHSASYQFKDF